MPEVVAMKPAQGGLGTFERYLSVWVALCMAAGIGLGKIAAWRRYGPTRHRIRQRQPD